MDFLPSADTLKGLMGLVLGFGFVIFVHELGHFLVAKWVGIKVTQFAIGFGQSVIAWRKGIGFRLGSTEKEYSDRIAKALAERGLTWEAKDLETNAELRKKIVIEGDKAAKELGLGETEYRLNWMPLGGYVKMLGQEDMDPTATSDDPRAFNRKPVWARACVISAGVIMNLIFALIFLIVAFKAGVELPPTVVGGVAPEFPAAIAYAEGHDKDPAYLGLQPGDKIVSINDEPVDDFSEIAVKVALAPAGEKMAFVVERPEANGKVETLHYAITPVVPPGSRKLLAIGVDPPTTLTIPEGKGVYLPLDARAAGVTPGMTITEVNGQKVSRYYELERIVEHAGAAPLKLKFARPNGAGEMEVTLSPEPVLPVSEGMEVQLLGLVPAAQVDGIKEGSPAHVAGLRDGDIIASIGNVEWPSDAEARKVIQETEDAIPLKVLRGDKIITVTSIVPRKGKLGIYMGYGPTVISHTLPGTPAVALELTRGSRITSVNGEPVKTFYDLQRLMSAAASTMPEGGKVTLGYDLLIKGNPSHTMAIDLKADDAKALAAAAWAPPLPAGVFLPESNRVSRDNLGDAAALGVKKTHQFMLQTYVTLLRLSQGSVPASEMRGPLGIAQEGTRIAQRGWPYLIFFLGVISINLVVINFLPIPIVDGGLMVFLIIEKIKGSPVGPRTLMVANIIGLCLIGCVFLTVTFFDVMRIFGKG